MDVSLELTNDSSGFDIIAYNNEKESRTVSSENRKYR